MGEKLSIRAFKEYCACHKFDEIFFSTENQDWYRASDPCKIQMSFKIMLISENPSLVFLKSDAGTLCFDRVRYVEINSTKTVLGTTIHVYCGGVGNASPEISYILVAE